MTEALFAILLASTLMLLAGMLFLREAGRRKRNLAGIQRLNEVLSRQSDRLVAPPQEAPSVWTPDFLDRLLQRAGLPTTRRMYFSLAAPALPLVLFAELFLGFVYALTVLLVVYPVLVWLFLRFRAERFRDQLVDQLPSFLESISRILSVGCGLELAFRNATEECEDPLQSICRQVVLRTQAGQSIEDALSQIAEIYGIKELGFVASVFHLGMRYGGNAHAVLERLSTTMRERLRSQQELKAMTAETRASAWILSALPVVVAAMTMISNPGYLLGMWTDPTGRKLLLVAFALQIIGMLLLFRMARLRS